MLDDWCALFANENNGILQWNPLIYLWIHYSWAGGTSEADLLAYRDRNSWFYIHSFWMPTQKWLKHWDFYSNFCMFVLIAKKSQVQDELSLQFSFKLPTNSDKEILPVTFEWIHCNRFFVLRNISENCNKSENFAEFTKSRKRLNDFLPNTRESFLLQLRGTARAKHQYDSSQDIENI